MAASGPRHFPQSGSLWRKREAARASLEGFSSERFLAIYTSKLTRAQYLDEVTWTTKSWLGLQKQRICSSHGKNKTKISHGHRRADCE